MNLMYGEISNKDPLTGDIEVKNPYVDFKIFIDIWNNVFPYVRIRVYKSVSGKCWTCHYINELRRTTRDSKILKAAKDLHQLHRGGMFHLERKRLKIKVFLLKQIN